MLAERIRRILNQTSDRIPEYSRDAAYRKCNEERNEILRFDGQDNFTVISFTVHNTLII